MWATIKSMLQSKKVLAAVLSMLAWGVARLGFKLNADEVLPLVAPLWVYVFGQGMADFGKEAKKLGG